MWWHHTYLEADFCQHNPPSAAVSYWVFLSKETSCNKTSQVFILDNSLPIAGVGESQACWQSLLLGDVSAVLKRRRSHVCTTFTRFSKDSWPCVSQPTCLKCHCLPSGIIGRQPHPVARRSTRIKLTKHFRLLVYIVPGSIWQTAAPDFSHSPIEHC